MKTLLPYIFLLFFVVGCQKELTFEEQSYQKKTSLPCKGTCPQVTVKIPIAKDVPVVADSINKKVFSVMKEIIYFGEKPYTATNYQGLLDSFIGSYEKMQTDFPDDIFGWEGEITAKVSYESDNLINIEIRHYTFTGGAHGYGGMRSLLFDRETGKTVSYNQLFTDVKAFTKFAETKFRAKFKIPENAPINSQGFMFENEKFALPQTIFFTHKGLLLYYNAYEIASYAEGPQELLLPYEQLGDYLKIK